jgi:rhodanese-related sulfurtransferase
MRYLLVTILLVGLFAAAKNLVAHQETQYSCFENIDNKTFKSKMEDTKGTVILDVRTKEEFDAGNIENGVNIDIFQSNFNKEIAKLDKEKIYLVYCHSGGRSARAAAAFCNLGFKNVYNLSGGYSSWE